MRIGEFEESVAAELAARRNEIASELPRLGAKLTEPLMAVRPAVPLADAVRISAEARAAHLAKRQAASPAAPFPRPSELVGALAAVLAAATPAQEAAAVERLAGLVRALQQSTPVAAASLPAGTASPAAQMLARAIGHQDLASQPEVLARLVRQLATEVGSSPGFVAAASSAVLERATLALLVASLPAASIGEALPAAAEQGRTEELPPGLLSFVGGGGARVRRRRSKTRDGDDDEQSGWLDDEELDPEELPYRSNPVRK